MRRTLGISGLGMAVLIATIVVAMGLATNDGLGVDSRFVVVLFGGLWLYWGLGALIVVRADGHLVGWLFALAAALTTSAFGCFAVGFTLLSGQPSEVAGGPE